MPSTLSKTRKQISKKRNGVVNALHEKSRDSLRLHKAGVRDQRIEKLAAARSKKEQPLVERAAFFQQALRLKEVGKAVEVEEIQKMVSSFVHQYDEEYDAVKKTRRAGRPASAKEDLLKVKISNLEDEYEKGFILPDLTDVDTVSQLHLWEGSWSYLTALKWIKVTKAGSVRQTSFPSSGGIN